MIIWFLVLSALASAGDIAGYECKASATVAACATIGETDLCETEELEEMVEGRDQKSTEALAIKTCNDHFHKLQHQWIWERTLIAPCTITKCRDLSIDFRDAARENFPKVAIKSAVRRMQAVLQGCFRDRAALNGRLHGRMDISWAITAGKVEDVKVLDDTTGDAELKKCVVEKIGHWRFAPDYDTTVRFPFLFGIAPADEDD